MHELETLIHKALDRMTEHHHAIRPRTHLKPPHALSLVADAGPTASGLAVLCPIDMVCHCAAHMRADGDLQGGLRNLWDFQCLAGDFVAADAGFWGRLDARAAVGHRRGRHPQFLPSPPEYADQ